MLFEAHSSYSTHVGADDFFILFSQSQFDSPEGPHGTLVEEFLNIRVPTEAQFTEHLLVSRLVRKIKPTAEKKTPFKQIHAVK